MPNFYLPFLCLSDDEEKEIFGYVLEEDTSSPCFGCEKESCYGCRYLYPSLNFFEND